MLVSSTGRNSTPAIFPRILNALFGTKFKIISGYSTSEMRLALEKGEVQGTCGLAWQTLQSVFCGLDRWGRTERDPADGSGEGQGFVGERPRFALDLLSKPDDRTFFRLAALPGEFGRPFVAPPGVPADRVRALRTAFDETMKDPEFVAAAAKAQMTIDPLDGGQIQALLDEAYAAPEVGPRPRRRVFPAGALIAGLQRLAVAALRLAPRRGVRHKFGMTDSAKGRVPILAAGGVVLRGMTRPRIAVVRLRHEKAWVLPKGKLFPREHARDAAVREVAEETGYDVSVHQFLGSMSYVVEARLKIVQFWLMRPAAGPSMPWRTM